MGKKMMDYFAPTIKAVSLVALSMWLSCGSSSQKVNTGDQTAGRLTEEAALMCPSQHHKHVIDLSEHNSMRWYYAKTPRETKGIALVIHGLNLRPDKMESIIARLTDSGIEALNLSLRGHGENYSPNDNSDNIEARLESFKTISYPIWMQETCEAYHVAKHRSDQQNVPLFLVGFSLGGLMGTDLLVTEPAVQFDKMVLFAPALKIHRRNYLIRVLSPFPRLTIPSFTVASYQSNDGTPMAGYNALFEALKGVAPKVGPKANVPTLVFIDKKDELVSYGRLKKMVADQKLDQWQFYIVQKEKTKGSTTIHHLIIDAPSTGEDVWAKMMAAMVKHLNN
jgi:esterase/lipase